MHFKMLREVAANTMGGKQPTLDEIKQAINAVLPQQLQAEVAKLLTERETAEMQHTTTRLQELREDIDSVASDNNCLRAEVADLHKCVAELTAIARSHTKCLQDIKTWIERYELRSREVREAINEK